jgi:hypothetical protein
MTNRLILNDPQLGRPPADNRDWAAYQRQLAEHTAPGFLSTVLPRDFTATTTTFATVTDVATTAKNISLYLKAPVKHWIELHGSYSRATSTDDVKLRLVFASPGVSAGQPEDVATASYDLVGTGSTVNHLYDPLDATGLLMTTTSGAGYSFSIQGWMNVTTAGSLTIEFAQNANSGAVDATLYKGTRLMAQPILNLADRSVGK